MFRGPRRPRRCHGGSPFHWSRTRRSPRRAASSAARQGGREIDRHVLRAVLSRPRIGEHLCHAMLLPRPEIAALSEEFASRGALDLGAARLTRRRQSRPSRHERSRASSTPRMTRRSPRLSSPSTSRLSIGRPRSPSCAASRSTTRNTGASAFLARASISPISIAARFPTSGSLIRDLGYVHKLIRGVAKPEACPDDVNGAGRKAMDRRGGHIRHWRPLPGLCAWTMFWPRRCFSDLAGAQGRDHSRICEFAPAALRR